MALMTGMKAIALLIIIFSRPHIKKQKTWLAVVYVPACDCGGDHI